MKKALIIIFALLAFSFASTAQDTTAVSPGKLVIDQTQAVQKAMSSHISRNASRRQTGYRIRIFFDNKQNARTMSEKVAAGFKAQHPGVSVYRDYENPYFKVTVGDFRTQQEAQALADRIVGLYPTAFVVREEIHYPAH